MTEDKTITGNLYGVPVTATFKGNTYTPTTEEVRRAYLGYLSGTSRSYAESGDEFDRWLAEVKAQAWDECAQEAYDRGMMHDISLEDIQTMNPYRQDAK